MSGYDNAVFIHCIYFSIYLYLFLNIALIHVLLCSGDLNNYHKNKGFTNYYIIFV